MVRKGMVRSEVRGKTAHVYEVRKEPVRTEYAADSLDAKRQVNSGVNTEKTVSKGLVSSTVSTETRVFLFIHGVGGAKSL